MKTLDMEILAPGKWNGVDITKDNMNEIVNNFSRLKDTVQVYLKLGHNKEQKETDGKPALGWADRLWVNGKGKLMARFMDIPDIVFEAISKKLYRNVSIEALLDVTHKGEKYGTVLTAVALLGADMPAVNTLSDLQTYMSADLDDSSGILELSAISGSIHDEDINMANDATLQAEIERLKAENEAKDKAIKLAADKTAKQESEIATLKANEEATKLEAKKAEFTRRSTAVKSDLEELVKAKVITPAKREELSNKLTEENIESIELTVDSLKDIKPLNPKDGDKLKGGGQDGGTDDLDGHPDDLLFAAAKKLEADNNIEFSAAVKLAMQNNPELAVAYRDYNDVA